MSLHSWGIYWQDKDQGDVFEVGDITPYNSSIETQPSQKKAEELIQDYGYISQRMGKNRRPYIVQRFDFSWVIFSSVYDYYDDKLYL